MNMEGAEYYSSHPEQRSHQRRRPYLRFMESHASGILPKKTPGNGIKFFPIFNTSQGPIAQPTRSPRSSSDLIDRVSEVRTVQQDFEEALKLSQSYQVVAFLEAWPDKRAWVENTIAGVRWALKDIGVEIDGPLQHSDPITASNSPHRFEGISSHHWKSSKKRQRLQSAHHNLIGAMHVMQTVGICALPGALSQDPVLEVPVRPWDLVEDSNNLGGSYLRHKHEGSNASISSLGLDHPRVSTQREMSEPTSLTSEKLPGPTYRLTEMSSPIELPGDHPITSALPTERSTLDTPSTLRRSKAVRSHVLPEHDSTQGLDESELPHDTEADALDRNNSIASTTTAVTVPVIARRYRAQTINLQKNTTKHNSLPSELPLLESQPSLIEDLVDWVDLQERKLMSPTPQFATMSPSTLPASFDSPKSLDAPSFRSYLSNHTNSATERIRSPEQMPRLHSREKGSVSEISPISTSITNPNSFLSDDRRASVIDSIHLPSPKLTSVNLGYQHSQKEDCSTANVSHEVVYPQSNPLVGSISASLERESFTRSPEQEPFLQRAIILPGCRSSPASPTTTRHIWEPLIDISRPGSAPPLSESNAMNSSTHFEALIQAYRDPKQTPQMPSEDPTTTTAAAAAAMAEVTASSTAICKRTASQMAPEVTLPDAVVINSAMKPRSALAKRREAHARRMQKALAED